MAESPPEFESLLEYIKGTTGIDFTNYKHPSLKRRLAKRLQAVGVSNEADYRGYLSAHPEEFTLLLNVLLINVTSFFRDPAAWQYLAETVVPRLLTAKPPDEPIRLWSAGCASGREAYSLAILFAEVLGMDAFRQRVTIYATDLDEDEIGYARRASYSRREVESVPPDLRDKYFERQGTRFACAKDLRRAVVFARHDLLRDAPISRIDLLCCRNTWMYFNTAGQAKVIACLHFAINDGGILFLGKAEMMAAHSNLFVPLNLKQRIFARVSAQGERERQRFFVEAGYNAAPPQLIPVSKQTMMQNMVFDAGTLAQVLVDRAGVVTMINEQARMLFGLTAQDVGRPLQDLELSYRPAELRSLIGEAYAEKHSACVRGVSWPAPLTGTPLTLDVTVVPLLDAEQSPLGATITFVDVTPQRQMQTDLQTTIRELETAYEELQSTNEELETTYEELQSTIEELDTTNEELQSTNEELETMNEELQFTNEELQTINGEARQHGEQLNEVNEFMASILRSFRAGVAVLDQELRVQVWNSKMEDLWGLRAEEAQGNHFWNLDIGLPVERLKQPLRAILSDRESEDVLLLDAHNRKGRAIVCRVTCMPLLGKDGARRGMILLMEQVTTAEPASSTFPESA